MGVLKHVTGNEILETTLHGLGARHEWSICDIVLHGLPNGFDVLLSGLW